MSAPSMIPCFNCSPVEPDPGCPYCSGKGQIQTDPETAAVVNASLRERAPLERYPVQITNTGGSVYALANDGTLWRRNPLMGEGADWFPVPSLPQP